MTRVCVYYHPQFLRHETGEHPERAERLVVSAARLRESELPLDWREPQEASLEALQRIHDSSYIELVKRTAEGGGGWLDWDTAVSPGSYAAALLAAGAGVQAVRGALEKGELSFLLVRPPGHHARRSRGMGFCLFNNIAVAAAYAVEELGLERVLIVDWDVHHGNGTQESFYRDPRVLFFSTHQAGHFPGTGYADEVGEGEGRGFNINVPLRAGDGDGAVLLAFERILLPVARKYSPQLVLVSAGYDAERGDPLGGLAFSTTAFIWMTARLIELTEETGAAGPICFLEGGYRPQKLAEAIEATIGVMAQGKDVAEFGPTPTEQEKEDVLVVVEALQPWWQGVL